MSTQGDKLKAIADAIRAKEGSSDPIPANDFPERIAAIETGTQLPTLTNPGTVVDLALGKQLIDQNGEIVEGAVYTVGSGERGSGNGSVSFVSIDANTYEARGTSALNMIFRSGSIKCITFPKSDFGNATAADVAAGKTFTSKAGVKVTGTSTGPKGFFISFQGLDSNTSGWFSYPGTGYPLALCVYALGEITTGSYIFMIGMAGNAGAYVTGTKKAIVEEVNYGGSASQSAFGVSISNGQMSFDSVNGTYFKSGVQYVGCGICN